MKHPPLKAPQTGRLSSAELYRRALQEQATERVESALLDKLEQKGTPPSKLGIQKFKKRAKQKHLSYLIAKDLVEYTELKCIAERKYLEADKLVRGFANMSGCCSTLEVTKDQVRSTYCGHRLCLVCSNIRTGKMLNRFEPIFATEFPDPWFITLSRPNVSRDKLGQEVGEYLENLTKVIKAIKAWLIRQGRKDELKGLRKLEVTWNEKENTYHPHLHLVVNDKLIAEEFLRLWMRLNPSASPKANKIFQANEGSLKELFKYLTKFYSKDKRTGTLKLYPAEVLYTIVEALYRRRTFGAYQVDFESEEDEIPSTQPVEGLIESAEPVRYFYQAYGHWNWFEVDSESVIPLVAEYGPKERADITRLWNRSQKLLSG